MADLRRAIVLVGLLLSLLLSGCTTTRWEIPVTIQNNRAESVTLEFTVTNRETGKTNQHSYSLDPGGEFEETWKLTNGQYDLRIPAFQDGRDSGDSVYLLIPCLDEALNITLVPGQVVVDQSDRRGVTEWGCD